MRWKISRAYNGRRQRLSAIAGLFALGLILFVSCVEYPLTLHSMVEQTDVQPRTAGITVGNQSVTGTGSNLWVTGKANASLEGTMTSFTGISGSLDMPLPTTGTSYWPVDKSVLNIYNMQEQRDWLSSIGAFGSSADWGWKPSVDMMGVPKITTAFTSGEATQTVPASQYSGDFLGREIESSTAPWGLRILESNVQNSFSTSATINWANIWCGESHYTHTLASTQSTWIYTYNDKATTTTHDEEHTPISNSQTSLNKQYLHDGSNATFGADSWAKISVQANPNDQDTCDYESGTVAASIQKQAYYKYRMNYTFWNELVADDFTAPGCDITLGGNFYFTASGDWNLNNPSATITHDYIMSFNISITDPLGVIHPVRTQTDMFTKSNPEDSANLILADRTNRLTYDLLDDYPFLTSQVGLYNVTFDVAICIFQHYSHSRDVSDDGEITARTESGDSPVTDQDEWADSVTLKLWDWDMNYTASKVYPKNAFGGIIMANDINLGDRVLSEDPTFTADVVFPNLGTQGDFSSADLAVFVSIQDGASRINKTYMKGNDYQFDSLVEDGYSGTISIPLTGFKDLLGSSLKIFKIGLGVNVTGGSFRVTSANTFSWTMTNFELSLKCNPTPIDIDLTWVVQSGETAWDNIKITTGTAGSAWWQLTANQAWQDNVNHKYYTSFSTNTTGTTTITFAYALGCYVKLEITDDTYYATYTASGTTYLEFIADLQIPIPRGTGLADDKNYNVTLWHNVSIPKFAYVSNPTYDDVWWKLIRAYDNNYLTFPQSDQLTMIPTNDSTYWLYTDPYNTAYVNINTATANVQEVCFQPKNYGYQLKCMNYINWHLRFNVTNEISTFVISDLEDCSTPADEFQLDTYCHVKAELLNATNNQILSLWYFHNNGAPWNITEIGNNGGWVNSYYLSAIKSQSQNLTGASVKGPGYMAVVYYNVTDVATGMTGVYRIGYRNASFEIVRPSAAPLTFINRIYDINNAAQNTSNIVISVNWTDPTTGLAITGTDVTTTISVSTWYTSGGFKYPDMTVGWWDLPLVYCGKTGTDGNYSIFILPDSEWRTMKGSQYKGNMTQGFHNFTIHLDKPGYEAQTITGNFSIVVDLYLEIWKPLHTSWFLPPNGDSEPHYLGNDATAGETFWIYADLRKKTPEDGVSDSWISNQSTSFYGGYVRINFTLILITDYDKENEIWDVKNNVNWTYNYHNGSFVEFDAQYKASLSFPAYAVNHEGYDASSREKLFWYNFTYYVARNYTLVPTGTLYEGKPLFESGFQPDIVGKFDWSSGDTLTAGTEPDSYPLIGCENSTSPGYSASTPSDDASMGKIVEEVSIIRLNREGSKNVTSICLITDNATDAGWAYSLKEEDHILPEFTAYGKEVQWGTYQVRNYWRNETEYSYIGLPQVAAPYYTSPYSGIEYKYQNRTDVIRFRVGLNCSYSQAAPVDTNNPWVPPCGLLNRTAQSENSAWEGNTVMKLLQWNASEIDLIWDSTTYWTFTFSGYNSSGLCTFTQIADTFVTPWLNLTELSSRSFTQQNMMPYISSSKQGYLDAQLYINLTILPQATNTTIETNSHAPVQTTRDQSMNSILANVTIPVGSMRSFSITYRDVTNDITDQYASHKYYNITGATIGITSLADDTTTGKIYYYGQGTTWWVTEIAGSPGKYNVTILVPDIAEFELSSGVNSRIDKQIKFTISKQNYDPKIAYIQLNITRRPTELILLWNKNNGITTYSPSETGMYTLSTAATLRYLTLSYTLLDKEFGTYIDLDNFVGSYINAFSYDSFWVNKIAEIAEDTSVSYRPAYNITLWPTSDNPAVDVTGIYYPTFTFNPTLALKNLAIAEDTTTTVEIRKIVTDFWLFQNETQKEYYDSAEAFDVLNVPSFQFQLTDLNHTTIFAGNNHTWSEVTADEDFVSIAWLNEFSSHYITRDFGLTSVQSGNTRTYTLSLDTYGMPADGTIYRVNMNLTKANYENITVWFTFTLNNRTTKFESLSINGIYYYASGDRVAQEEPEIAKKIAWGDPMNVLFQWVTGDGQAIKNNTAINRTIIEFENFPTNNVTWVQQHQTAIPGTYAITCWTNRTDISLAGSGYNTIFSINVSKPNYAPVSCIFNVTIRKIQSELRVFAVGETDIKLADLNRTILWGDNLQLYFELVEVEKRNGDKILSVERELSVNNVLLNGTTQGTLDAPWVYGGIDMGNYAWTHRGIGSRHLFLLNLETQLLNVSMVPNGASIYLNVTKQSDIAPGWYPYDTPLQLVNVTIRQRSISGIVIAYGILDGESGPANNIDVEKYNTFRIRLQIMMVTGNPQNPTTPVIVDDFVVTYQVLKRNPDTLVLENLTTPIAGELTWDPLSQSYFAEIAITEEFSGTIYFLFNVTSKSGNFQDMTIEKDALFQAPITITNWWPVIIAAIMIGAVGIYTIRKALQLRIPLILRLIDETITKIQADKYPPETGVLVGRNEFMVNTLLDRLEQVGIEWEKAEKFTIEEAGKAGEEPIKPPMNLQEINAALDAIPELTVEEKAIFADELKRLARKEQDEFIDSLKHQAGGN